MKAYKISSDWKEDGECDFSEWAFDLWVGSYWDGSNWKIVVVEKQKIVSKAERFVKFPSSMNLFLVCHFDPESP